MEIKGIGALVSGGASGLGEASARQLIQDGARVAILDLDQERGQALAEKLGQAAVFLKTDVTDEASVQAAVDAAAAGFGAVHLVLNCAGVAPAAKVLSKEGPMSLAGFNKVVQINLIGTINLIRLAAAKMVLNEPLNQDGERGVIINTASVAAFEGQIGQAAYASSKAAVVGLTLPLAREFAAYGIRVMAIAPGIFETPMMAGLPEKARLALPKMVPFPPRLGAPAEYARLVKHIIENPMLNGETIRLDAALRMAAK